MSYHVSAVRYEARYSALHYTQTSSPILTEASCVHCEVRTKAIYCRLILVLES